MNVYDFDKTIYPVDSTAQFYFWCLKRYPACRRTFIPSAWGMFCLVTHLQNKTRSKQIFYRFLRYVPPEAPQIFWQEHMADIRPWYYEQRRPDDLIISASPDFFLTPVSQALEFALIASPVDPSTGQCLGLNCDGQEKVRRYREIYSDTPVDGFWSDSRSDAPMASIAMKAWRIRRGIPTPW